MRKSALLLILAVLCPHLTGCSFTEPAEPAIEMIAFGSLSKEEQALIPVSPKDAVVEKIPVRDDIRPYLDRNDDNGEVYSVTFKHTQTDSRGELTVFVSLDKKTVVGKGFIGK